MWIASVGLMLLLAGALVWQAGGREGDTLADSRPAQVLDEDYVSSRTCRSCHPDQYASWHNSYHRTMTQVARPENLAGPWDGQVLSVYDESYLLEQRGDELWVERIDEPGEFPVVLTTGSHHFQAYWLASGQGRQVRLFQLAYHLGEQRFVPFDTIMLAPPEYRQAQGHGGQWNEVCLECHSTDPRPRRLGAHGVDTQVGELGIACEACHGPAQEHIARNRNALRRYWLHFTGSADDSIVLPTRLEHDRSSQVCGQCHAVRAVVRSKIDQTGFTFRPGDDLHETRTILHSDGKQLPTADVHTRFWPDGQIRVGGREYNSLLRSPCFERGELECSSCHQLHQGAGDLRTPRDWADDQLQVDMRTSQACVQCHTRFADVPTLAAHTNHPPASVGSECMNCHMPNTAWGLQKATRSHQITNPTVTESVEYGRPNACNLCHLDRTLGWAADQLEAWYGTPQPPAIPRDDVAAGVRWLVAGDAGQRALATWHMGWAPAQEASGRDWLAPYVGLQLREPYPMNRQVALNALRTLPGFESFDVDPLADSEVRDEAVQRLLEIFWKQGGAPSHADRPEVLVNAAGGIDRQSYNGLVLTRNHRRVYLME